MRRPLLRNMSYDGILQLEMPSGTYLVGFADDVAAVIVARDTEEIQMKIKQVMRRVICWMDAHGIQIAAETTNKILTR